MKELNNIMSKIYKITNDINNKVYIDGYEFKKGKWRKTIKALWYKWF